MRFFRCFVFGKTLPPLFFFHDLFFFVFPLLKLHLAFKWPVEMWSESLLIFFNLPNHPKNYPPRSLVLFSCPSYDLYL